MEPLGFVHDRTRDEGREVANTYLLTFVYGRHNHAYVYRPGEFGPVSVVGPPDGSIWSEDYGQSVRVRLAVEIPVGEDPSTYLEANTEKFRRKAMDYLLTGVDRNAVFF